MDRACCTTSGANRGGHYTDQLYNLHMVGSDGGVRLHDLCRNSAGDHHGAGGTRLAVRSGRHAFAAQNAVVDREVGDGVDKDLAVANKKTPPSEDGGANVEAVSRSKLRRERSW
jgi:hypothetical protein